MSQIVDRAIKRSRSHNEIVTITRTEIGISGVSLESIHHELFEACEGNVLVDDRDDNRAHRQYWGHGTDGPDDMPWRVHVPR